MSKQESLYMSIYTHLKKNMQMGLYDNGKRLPTEMELAAQFYVSRITTKRALNALAQDGSIIRIPGKGSFVREYFQRGEEAVPSTPQNTTIALVMGGYSGSFGLDIMNGVIETAEQMNLHVIVKSTLNCQAREAKIIRDLIEAGVAGMLLQPAQGEFYSETILRAVYDKVPIVMVDRMIQGINVPYVGVDNVMLSRVITEKLLHNNHRNIALIAFGDEASSTIKERMHGFTEAFLEGGHAINKGLFFTNLNTRIFAAGLTNNGDEAYEFIVNELQNFVLEHPTLTAIFGTEYSISRAALEAVRRLGKSVPADISIVSFDADARCGSSQMLSHIQQPQREMGIKACQVLQAHITGTDYALPQACILPGEWVDGFSIRKLEGHKM